MKVLMVCLGNICRSPMAEGLLRHKAKQSGIAIETDSCGTGSWHVGNPPDERAIQNLSDKNIDISDLRARTFSVSDFEEFDEIFCMDASNYNNILALASKEEHKSKVKMILNEGQAGSNRAVPDPYFGGDDGFEEVYELLDHSIDCFLKRV